MRALSSLLYRKSVVNRSASLAWHLERFVVTEGNGGFLRPHCDLMPTKKPVESSFHEIILFHDGSPLRIAQRLFSSYIFVGRRGLDRFAP